MGMPELGLAIAAGDGEHLERLQIRSARLGVCDFWILLERIFGDSVVFENVTHPLLFASCGV
jgi:hypothetical protein